MIRDAIVYEIAMHAGAGFDGQTVPPSREAGSRRKSRMAALAVWAYMGKRVFRQVSVA